MCGSMTQDKTRHVVNNDEGVRELSELTALNVERMGCIAKSKDALTKAARDSTKGDAQCLE